MIHRQQRQSLPLRKIFFQHSEYLSLRNAVIRHHSLRMSINTGAGSLKHQSADKAIELLNSADGFTPIRKAVDLIIGKPYLVIGAEIRKSSYGKRMALTLRDTEEKEENTFLLYLGQSFAQTTKSAAIQSALTQTSRALYIELLKIRTDTEFLCPVYRFFTK